MRGLQAEGLASGNQLLLQFQNAPPGTQAGFQLQGVKRLRQVVVRARLQTADDILLIAFGRQ